MINWNYDANNAKSFSFEPIPVGDHRVRIAEAEEQMSKAGNQMIKLTLDVSAHAGKLFYYLVFDPAHVELTNGKLSDIYKAFQIQPGNLNLGSWVGSVGGVRVKHGTYEGDAKAEVSYFLKPEKIAQLPTWQDAAKKSDGLGDGDFTPIQDDDDVPF